MDKNKWMFKHSVACKASKAFAWAFWTDVSNWERLEGAAVEWIKLKGPFEKGTSGETKMPGQDALQWKIVQLDLEHSATIDMPLHKAILKNKIIFAAVSENQTSITQVLSLEGVNAYEYAEGMKMFETSAPQGLAKLAEAIELAFKC